MKINNVKKKLIPIFSVFVILLIVVAMLLGNSSTVLADEVTSDANTTTDYTTHLSNDSSTRYAGRVWTDKTVYTGNATFTGDVGQNVTVNKSEDADFLVSYSALATSQEIIGKSTVPVDVVFVIDLSGSMSNEDSGMTDGRSRIANLVDALNKSMESVLATHDESRVGVVGFNGNAFTILNLDHYSKYNNYKYFSLNRERPSNDNATLTARAISSQGSRINSNFSVSGGTNTHMGIDAGMDMLRNASDTTVNIDGNSVSRYPSLIFLSDGSPTYSGSDDSNWWNPSGQSGTGYSSDQGWNYDQGDSTYQKFSMKTIMNAAYGKQKVNQHYNIIDPNNGMKVYTVGIGLDDLDNDNKNLARITLDPLNYLDANNNHSQAIKNAWTTYSSSNVPRLDNYRFTHPNSDDISSIMYNDHYYSADTSDEIANVFEDISTSISTSVPQYPTQVDSNNALEGGYITFTDPLGKYMEVKNVNALIYGGQKFELESTSTTDNVTTYQFTGEIESPVYGKLDASHIIIEVENTDNHQQTVIIKIPAAAIPLRVNTITLNEDGSVHSNEHNSAYPVRILYSVGLESGIDKNLTGVDADYINANTVDGKVNFYSNQYSGTKQGDVTVGDTTVEFTPAKTNPFYFIQEDTALYTDENGHNQATSYDENATYYMPVQYYEGKDFKTIYIARHGSTFKNYYKIDNGGLFVIKGAPRLGNLADFIKNKVNSSTQTANSYYYPTFVGDVNTGEFKVYLGNNGVAKYDAPSSLTVSKVVNSGEGLTAPDQTFTFEITMESKAGKTLKGILSTNQSAQQNISFDENGKATITLKANESLEILNVGKDVDYTIKEVNLPKGFTSDKSNNQVTGTTTATDATVTFTNTYEVDPITSTALSLNLGGQKTITGRDFKAGDKFEFSIAAAQSTHNAPLPQKEGQNVTTATINPTSGTQANFAFDGVITFTKPGNYKYIITETNTNLSGIDYDASIYRYSVTIKDNGLGELVLDGTPTIEKAVDGSWVSANEISFANNYSATDATVAIRGMKVLNVSNSDLSLTDNQFKFKIEALGSNTDGSDTFNTDNTQPMPATTEIGNIANGDVLFGNMTFDQSMVGKTYGYKVTEILPAGVTKDSPTLNGVTYDTSEKIVKVTVTTSSEGGEHVVAIITPNDNSENFTFTNAYEPTKITIGDSTNAGIQVQKTFTGRNWTNDDEFEYTISSQTQNAPMPENTKVTISKPATGNVNSIQFGEMTFTKAGSYVYQISESEGSLGGITYDSHSAEVTVNVTEDKVTGTLSASIVYNNTNAITDDDKTVTNAAAFTNTYKAIFDDTTAINLNGKKVLNGKTLGNGEFFFTIQAVDDAPLGDGETLTPNSADGTIKLLQNIKYDNAGTYTYLISEQIPSQTQKGMTYDESVYKVTVTVTDNQNGKLTAAITNIEKAANKDGQYNKVDSIQFTNNYQPLSTTYSPVKVTKQLTGDRNTPLQANEFEFEISVSSATPSDGIQLPDNTKVKNSADGTVQFGNITFTKVGTYIVEIKEVVPDSKVPGITYDEHVIRSTFNVTDNQGQLVVARTGSTGSQTFTNRYSTSGTINGQTDLRVTKNLTGRDWKDSDTFKFVLEGNDEITKQAITDGKVVLPENADGIEITGKMTDKIANFGDITFNAVGEYEFAVKEDIPDEKISGVTYDSTLKVIKVETTDNNDGTLSVNIISNELNTPFVNNYAPGETTLPGSANLNVTKTFNGRANNEWLENDIFEFTITGDSNDQTTLEAIDNQYIVLSNTTIEVNKDHHEANFGDITFKKAGTYKFTVSEVKGNIPGVTYDKTVKTVIVNVVDNNDGTMTATLDDSSDKLEFINTYSVEPTTLDGSANLGVTKVFTGRIDDEWLDSDEFNFSLELVKGKADNVIMPANADAITVTKDSANKSASFGDITFKAPGEYEFTVKEIKGNIAGVNYDTSEKTVVVNVTDNKDGTLTATVDTEASDDLSFTNIYNHGSTTITGETDLTVTKKFTGRVNDEWLETDQFSFRLELVDGEATDVVLPEQTVSVTADHKTAHFGNIIFHEPGTYKFTVSEVKGNIDGVTYDDAVKTIVVNVVDNKDGTMTATLDQSSDKLEFTNTYSVEPTTLDGSANLGVTKVFTGRINDEWLDSDVFSFSLELTKGTSDNVIMPVNADTITVTKDSANKSASFGDITFKAPGEYEFTVKEIKGNIAGVNYDTSEKTVVVNVTDNKDGTLTATVDTEASDDLSFTNVYKHDVAIIDGDSAIKVTKVLNGRLNNEWLDTDSFTFTLTPTGDTVKAVEDKIVILPNNLQATATKDSQVATFDQIQFKEPGIYTFSVQEQKGNLGGISYDETAYPVTVTVTDNLIGQLNASISYGTNNDTTLTVTNVYSTGDSTANYTIKGTKKLTGRDWQDEDQFTFELSSDDEATLNAIDQGLIIMPTTQVTINGTDSDHQYSFDEIVFKQTGEYEFTVKELESNIKGITTDQHTAIVKVTVTDNNEGKIVAAGATTVEGSLNFENKYEPLETSIPAEQAIVINKTLNGRDMLDKEFTFSITPENGEPIIVDGKASKDGVAVAMDAYSAISFTEEGSQTFTVKEEKGSLGGITYDESVYTVTYTAKDNLHGSFDITRTITKDGKTVDSIDFVNIYKTTPVIVGPSGTAQLSGKKIIDNQDPNALYTIKGGEFNFEIKALGDNNAPLPEKTIVTNEKDGTFVFGNIEFKQTGVYQYQISELNNGLAGMSYDAKTFDITIEVTDDGKGQLHAKVTGNNDIQFTNKYDPTDITASLNGTKTLNGRQMKANEFTFILEAGDETTQEAMQNQSVILRNGESTLTTTNTEAGTINFGDDAITFKQAGTYKFNIKEQAGSNDTITYDTTIHQVTAKVSDEAGALKIEWSGANTIAFENSYKPHPGTVNVPLVKKSLDGRELKADEFTFTLSDSQGTVLKTVSNNENGIVDFGTLTFDEAGNYTFLVKEIKDNLGGVTYDSSQYYVDIEIKDLDGQLTATSTLIYDSDRKPVENIIFNNTYVAQQTEVTLGATKKLNGRTLKDKEFTFALSDQDGKVIEQVQNDGNGNIQFTTLTFDKAGTYTYTISEVKGEDKDITYDKSEKKVTVTVTDDGLGQLNAVVTSDELVFTNTYTQPAVEGIETGDTLQVVEWLSTAIVSAALILVVYRKKFN